MMAEAAHVLDMDIEKRLGAFTLDVQVQADNELLVLFGPSGSGKTVTLRCIAGLETPDTGTISIGGEPVFDTHAKTNIPARRRPIAFVPQGYALFPHMTVEENIAFGMPRSPGRPGRIRELLTLLHLEGLERRYPRTLSGGQQQRVALARALARDVEVLLLDEPFSALDEALREGLRHELLRLRQELGLTTVFVTHDLREAHLLADHMAVIDAGRILQTGGRDEVFKRPASRRVAQLTGVENILPATVLRREDDAADVTIAGMSFRCTSLADGATTDDATFAGVRAERINLRRWREDVPPNHLVARVADEWAYGNTHTLRFEPAAEGPALVVELASRPYEVLGVSHQREWLLEVPPEDLHLMPA